MYRSHFNHTHSRKEIDLNNKSRREFDSMGSEGDPIKKLKLLCLCNGARGLMTLGRMFRRMDYDENKYLNLEEFIQALRDTEMGMTDDEAKLVFDEFDTDNDGYINVDEFLIHIRPPMSDYRKQIIEKCYNKMDRHGVGLLTTADLKREYNIKCHPTYISGEEDAETVTKRFLANFEYEDNKDGIVKKEEFLDYYAGISASIDNDCYFDLMLRHAYNL